MAFTAAGPSTFVKRGAIPERWLFCAAALIVLATVAVVSRSGHSGSSSPAAEFQGREPRQTTTLPQGAPVAGVSKTLARNFSVFRTSTSGIPTSGIPTAMAQSLGSPYGANWKLARMLDMGVWVVPAQNHVCLFSIGSDGGSTMGCTATKMVLRHGIFIAFLSDPSTKHFGQRRKIIGLAPDGVRAVRLLAPGYKAVVAKVRRGLFSTQDNIMASPQTVSLLR